MNVFDYLPHRLALNWSLRKSADQLRMTVDECQEEYERRAATCEAEIGEAKSQLEARRKDVRTSLEAQLQTYEAEMAGLLDDVSSYSDCLLRLKCLRDQAKLQAAIFNIHKEDDRYLSEQMNLIGKEVELLRARRDELSALVAVDDFVELSQLSADVLKLATGEDCERLLRLISNKLDGLPAGHDAERFALRRLRSIVKERAEYLPLIQYVEWVIQQKIDFSKELKRTRATVRDQLGETKQDLGRVGAEIDEVTKELDMRARMVRMHWAGPIARLNAEIYYYSKQKSTTWDEMKSVEREIKHMKDAHPSDQWKRDHLTRQQEQCYSQYEQLKMQISEKKDSTRRMSGIRRSVSNICSDNGVPLKGDGNRGKSDELAYVETRLADIEQIRADGYAAAVVECDAKKQALSQKRDARLDKLARQLDEADARLQPLVAEEEQCTLGVREAKTALEARRAEDTRFFLFRLFDSQEVAAAKKSLSIACARCSAVKEKRATAETSRNNLQETIEAETASFEQKLAACCPHPLRPNADERLEEKMLKMYGQELEADQ